MSGTCIVEDCVRPSTSVSDECYEHLEEWKAEQRRLHPRANPPASLVILRVDGDREGYVCSDCDPDEQSTVEYLVGTLESKRPVCAWHKDEAIHEAIPHGANCNRCGIEHAALYPDVLEMDA